MSKKEKIPIRISKPKVDIAQFVKLNKALLIMFVHYNFLIHPHLSKKFNIASINYFTKGSYFRLAYEIKLGREKKVGYRCHNSNERYYLDTPSRCSNLANKIRQLYPRISEIKEHDRQVVINIDTILNPESLDWAEFVAKQEGIEIAKQYLVSYYKLNPERVFDLVDTKEEADTIMNNNKKQISDSLRVEFEKSSYPLIPKCVKIGLKLQEV